MTASSTTLSAKSFRRLLLPLFASFGVENERHVDAEEAAAISTHRGRVLIVMAHDDLEAESRKNPAIGADMLWREIPNDDVCRGAFSCRGNEERTG